MILHRCIRPTVFALLACLVVTGQAMCATLTGKVTLPDGGPAVGASVMLSGFTEFRLDIIPISQATTSADGIYKLDVPPGEYSVVARYGTMIGYTWFSLNDAGVTNQPSDVKLAKGCMLMGMAVDRTTGQMLPDARVNVQSLGSTQTDSNGLYGILVIKGPINLTVTKEGYASVALTLQTGGQDLAALKIETGPDGVLSGKVTDDQGNPIAGANVGADAMRIGTLYTKSDAQGNYSLAGLDPTQISSIYVNARGYESIMRDNLVFGPDSRRAEREYKLKKTDKRSITGRVTTPGGSPAKGAVVSYGHGSGDIDSRSAVTDDNGCYTIKEVSVRKAVLMARAKGYAPGFALAPENVDARVDLTMGPGHVLQGRVIDSAGNPVVGEGVNISVECPPRGQMYPGSASLMLYDDIARIPTDNNGYFRIEDMPAGNVYCRAFYRDYTLSGNVALPVDKPGNVMTLQPLGEIRGQVVNDEDGTPITNFTAGWTNSGQADTFASSDGTFTLIDMFSGPGDNAGVVVRAPGYNSASKVGLTLSAKSDPNQPIVEFRLKRSNPFSGRVTDSSGKPLAGVQVTLVNALSSQLSWQHLTDGPGVEASARTDSDGRLKVENAPSRAATVALYREGYGRRTIEMHPMSKPLEASLDTGATINAPVRDSAGNVPSDGSVEVIFKKTGERIGIFTPDANGNVSVADLAPGRYAVRLDYGSQMRSSRQVDLAPGQRYTVDWNQTYPVVIKGTLTAQGKPLPGAGVTVNGLDGDIVATTETDDQGRYSTSVLDPGSYLLVCTRRPYNSTDFSTMTSRLDFREGINQVDEALPSGSVSGTLMDKSTGKPLARAEVRAYWLGMDAFANRPNYNFLCSDAYWWSVKESVTDADGRFVFGGLKSGRWIIAARASSKDGAQRVLPSREFTLDIDESKKDLGIAVDTGNVGSAEILVKSPSGVMLNGALGFLLTCRGENGFGYLPTAQPRQTGQMYKLDKSAGGSTVFAGLPAGKYRLFVPATSQEHLLGTTRDFEIMRGKTTKVSVTLKRGSAIVFRLTPDAADRFGDAITIGYKVTKHGSGTPVIEDGFGHKLGGILHLDKSGQPASAAVPLAPGEYDVEAVVRWGSDDMFCENTRADLWSVKTAIKLLPNEDSVISISLGDRQTKL